MVNREIEANQPSFKTLREELETIKEVIQDMEDLRRL